VQGCRKHSPEGPPGEDQAGRENLMSSYSSREQELSRAYVARAAAHTVLLNQSVGSPGETRALAAYNEACEA